MKKYLAVLLSCAVCVSFAACSAEKSDSSADPSTETVAESQEENTDNEDAAGGLEYSADSYLSAFNPSDYVDLGQYKGLEVEFEPLEVSKEEVEYVINYMLQNAVERVEITDRAVQDGDLVNIDYSGAIDGVVFDGGTAQNQELKIGSHTFIDGFEDGLIGAEVGETRDVLTQFPDPYSNQDLAGKEAVFTVTVNAIYEESVPQLNDDFVKKQAIDGVNTVAEYRAHMEKRLMEEAQAERDNEVGMALLEQAVANATFKGDLPAAMVERYNDQQMATIENACAQYGMTTADYLQAVGYTEEDIRTIAEDSVKQLLVMAAIAQEENQQITPEELTKNMISYASDYGMDVDSFKEVLDVESFTEYILGDKILAFLRDNGKIIEK